MQKMRGLIGKGRIQKLYNCIWLLCNERLIFHAYIYWRKRWLQPIVQRSPICCTCTLPKRVLPDLRQLSCRVNVQSFSLYENKWFCWDDPPPHSYSLSHHRQLPLQCLGRWCHHFIFAWCLRHCLAPHKDVHFNIYWLYVTNCLCYLHVLLVLP